MNCDLAFELMTDAAGCGSQALRSHLAECPRCRQMQATLAPALEWLSPAGITDGPDSLPPSLDSYPRAAERRPAPTAIEAVEIAQESAAVLAARTIPARTRYLPIAGKFLRSAALILVGGLAAVFFVPGLHPTAPDADEEACLRHEAAAATSRSPSKTKMLAMMCTICHDANDDLRPHHRRTGATGPRSPARFAFGDSLRSHFLVPPADGDEQVAPQN